MVSSLASCDRAFQQVLDRSSRDVLIQALATAPALVWMVKYNMLQAMQSCNCMLQTIFETDGSALVHKNIRQGFILCLFLLMKTAHHLNFTYDKDTVE